MEITIKVTDLVLFALSLDDYAMQKALDVKVTSASGRWNNITGGLAEVSTVLSDIRSRGWNSENGGEGWDQPKSWEFACRRAYKSIEKQLDAQGYKVAPSKKFYIIQIVPKA